MKKRITVICLAVIALAELIVTRDMFYSLRLWILYGLYKVVV